MDAIKLTGVWKQKDKAGHTYLSGSLSPISRLLIMPNTFKKEDKEPDYFVYLKPVEKPGKQGIQGKQETLGEEL